ncbi:nucleotidyltransferase domain-containing protein [Mucilaginibacter sp. ZB1P21]|uniref:Nucleotidyltransferase domain-containing protein n=1 Tax=Mucilaginibacter glaciei TaxID=2772109 RepID=A0A926NVF5_9SPHI|nr:nucleotidyltransferase domain-containing protein [Mucilaginibacter glaciei]
MKELYAFGSVARGTDNEASDIDLIVEIDELNPISKGKLLLSLFNKFEAYFNKKVDLLTVDSVQNPVLEEYIGTSKEIVYARD